MARPQIKLRISDRPCPICGGKVKTNGEVAWCDDHKCPYGGRRRLTINKHEEKPTCR